MTTILGWLLLAIAGIALLCSTGFLAMTVAAARGFRRRVRASVPASCDLPAVTLFKPVYGLEPGLERNLASFFAQDYPNFEIVFGARHDRDPAIALARQLSDRYPHVPVSFVFSGEPQLPNAKVWSWHRMYAATSNEFFIISDSDVCVQPGYLRAVITPLLDPKVGLVTCVYRGVPTTDAWSLLESLGYSVEMTSGVIVSNMLEGMTFALGPTMASRREVVEAIGGIEALGSFYADDYVFGNRVSQSKYKVVLSTEVIEHVSCHRGLRASLRQQVRWMRSTRFSRPAGHFSSVLTFAMPFGILAMLASLPIHQAEWGFTLLVTAIANRMLLAVVSGWGVVGDRRALWLCWLFPLRDLMGFCFWCAGYFGRDIVWRGGERFRFQPGGSMTRVPADTHRPVT